MASIRKHRDKWQVQIRRKGVPAVSRSFCLKRDAEIWARQFEIEVDQKGLPVDTSVLRKTTLRDLVERYRDEVCILKRGRDVEQAILNAFLRDPLAGRYLSDLLPQDFSAYRDMRLEKCKPATINRELGLVQHVLTIAIREWGYPLSNNPVVAIKKPSPGPSRDRRLVAGELEALMEAVKQTRNQVIEGLILFALETGMRRGEMLKMEWGHLIKGKRILLIPVTKNGHPRRIPLSSIAVSILEEVGDRNPKWVFPTTADALKACWKRLCTRAGIEGLHFHDLRHEAISRFFERGLAMPEVALISGHRDPRMLMRYTHLRAEDLVAKIDH
jgi:integrase